MQKIKLVSLLTLFALIIVFPVFNKINGDSTNPIQRISSGPFVPAFSATSHKRNKLRLSRENGAVFGGSNYGGYPDFFTDEQDWIGSEFPIHSGIQHLLSGSILLGGVVGGDTLVSTAMFEPRYELLPEVAPAGHLIFRSTVSSNKKELTGAVSEEDYIAIFTDTFLISVLPSVGYDEVDPRPHQPLHIEVTEKSYAWTLAYSEDFIIFDISLKNIGDDVIHDAFFGINIIPEVGWFASDSIYIGGDDICGFLKSYLSDPECGFWDTLNMAWTSDNDGDPYGGQFIEGTVPYRSARHVMGISFIGLPNQNLTYSFNWWNSKFYLAPDEWDFGPRHRDNFRNFGTGGLGYPHGDRNKYHLLSNGEIDYDLPLIRSIKEFDLTWKYPDQRIVAIEADGHEHQFFYSIGPFDIAPGSAIPLFFVVAMGENFHTKPNNITNLYSGNVDAYYSNLDFSDLAKNAMAAKWIYDNPGIDTDGDGYKGEFRICVLDSVLDIDSNWVPTYAETTYYKGDGVPDWKAALPPPPPKMWVTPMFKGIHIRFNGSESENSKDIFTQMNDFEGFKIYLARDDRESSFSLIASYDIENYDKFVWNYQKQPDPGWDLLEFPMQLRDIRCNYAFNCNDSSFDPLRYRPSQPYVHPQHPESLFYWENHNWNTSEFGVTSNIKKIYPTARDPRKIPADSLTPDDYTSDGYLKFFDYEFTIENLLPTVQYYVSVTAFDFGWPASNLEPLETSITDNAQAVFASVIDSVIADDYKKVVVYPNPYRGDEGYRPRGFEGLGQDDRSNERVRRIHFANLPPKCKIMIYSLDGDLVREIHHDKSPNDPTAAHEEWGLISKNGLAVVSGLYYWVVESDDGTVQMGKLAIIL